MGKHNARRPSSRGGKIPPLAFCSACPINGKSLCATRTLHSDVSDLVLLAHLRSGPVAIEMRGAWSMVIHYGPARMFTRLGSYFYAGTKESWDTEYRAIRRRIFGEVYVASFPQGLPFSSSFRSSLTPTYTMAEKEDKPPTTYARHRLESVSNSFDSLTPPALTPEEETRAWRKVDIRLMPIVALLYLFSFLDRGASCRFSTSWLVPHPEL